MFAAESQIYGHGVFEFPDWVVEGLGSGRVAVVFLVGDSNIEMRLKSGRQLGIGLKNIRNNCLIWLKSFSQTKGWLNWHLRKMLHSIKNDSSVIKKLCSAWSINSHLLNTTDFDFVQTQSRHQKNSKGKRKRQRKSSFERFRPISPSFFAFCFFLPFMTIHNCFLLT